MCSLSRWWFKPWAAPCSAHWDGSVLPGGGRPRQQETALAARSHSRLSGASQRAAPAGQRLLYGFPQAKGTLSLEKKKKKSLASVHHTNPGLRETPNTTGLSFPILKCSPNISSYRVIGFPAPLFLRGRTVLHPNSYLEKAAASQIKLHRGFLAPRSDRGNSAHPTHQSPQPWRALSQDGKADLKGWQSRSLQAFFSFPLLNTHNKNSKQTSHARSYHDISLDGFLTSSKQITVHR